MKNILVLPLLLILLLGGCIPTAVEEFEAELQNLEEAWQLGGQTRQSLLSKELPVDRGVCQRMYQDTHADEAVVGGVSEEFTKRHQSYYINGCLGIGQPSPSGTPTPTE